jgi:hypothetical protein
VIEQDGRVTHLPLATALSRLAACAARTAADVARNRVHLPRDRVGTSVRFADGSTSRIYRETVIDRPVPQDPCVLVVQFRLRLVRGWGHGLFRAESMLNTPLFAGFPGFVSKLWFAADEFGIYRGCYDWDGPGRAESYVSALWWPLALVCDTESIRYRVLPGLHRDDVLTDPGCIPAAVPVEPGQWWRPVESW